MIETITALTGYSATVVGTSLMLPQVYKTWKTKSAEDVSWGMLALYFLNCALWLTYGAEIKSTPLMLTNGIALLISIAQIGLKLKYSNPSRK
jgi:MtN3 and saliva related transmembrane protein